MKNINVIEIEATNLGEGLKQLADQLTREGASAEKVKETMDRIAQGIMGGVMEGTVEEGREAVNEAGAYIHGHIIAAGQYLDHTANCNSCAQKTEVIAAMKDLKTKAEAANEALKAFAAAEEVLEELAKEAKGAK